jgi:hypothetical protein
MLSLPNWASAVQDFTALQRAALGFTRPAGLAVQGRHACLRFAAILRQQTGTISGLLQRDVRLAAILSVKRSVTAMAHGRDRRLHVAARTIGRELIALGHKVRLIPPQYVKTYVKRSKNDRDDAKAICEAAGRSGMHFVPVKSIAQQGRSWF